ncbi:MAG: NAD(P)H-dependent oxidoreductase [Myxococcota bacterium]|nr:NAD(P)H-dependent oxidoreductase [Myxococcota bacterium]
MSKELVVLGISGSLRKGSYNTALLRAAVELAPIGMRIEMADISGVVLYDEDVRSVGQPPAVAAFRNAIARADALLIATPEYNYSVPGVLKNAIDWASRPPNHPFAGKPLAIVGASGGASGTIRAQYHLRQIAVCLDMHPINKPELFVRSAERVFDRDGKLADQATRDVLQQVLEALGAWTRKLRQ